MSALITSLSVLFGIATGVITTLMTKGKVKADTQQTLVQASSEVIEQLREEIKRLHATVIEERVEGAKIKQSLIDQDKKLKDYKRENLLMEKRNKEFNDKIESLGKEVAACAEEKNVLIKLLIESGANLTKEDATKLGLLGENDE